MQGQLSTTQLNIAGLIHDMKSPLQALKGITSGMVTSDALKAELIQEASEQLEKLLHKMRMQNLQSTQTSSNENFCLRELVQRISNFKKVEYPFKRFSIKVVDLTCGNTKMAAEKIEIERLISNLLNNSIEALGVSGKIKITIAKKGENLSVSIKDNGHGIPNELLTHLAIAGNSFGKPEGTGLGLFQAKQTVESLNGQLNIESILSIGTIVSLDIPTQNSHSHLQLAKG
ncbi:GHKL domain protein [Bacteriovorax sp. BSW11_IV]|uniref:sensor histidine kinase n=1 Tax=Bacteriovorax sp. BSW11_IV TaxID=1353529 RepID=UPI00038A507C|nr:sensor histidine kinase [Bacteriovorax sp. BSW11_IV]EQC48351.1 GHKL domain protein [Bacteriovorax sp. BSW11_IV]